MARSWKAHNLPYWLFLWVTALQCSQCLASRHTPDDAITKRQAPVPAALVDFQVYEPVLTPSGTADQYGCVYTQLLMDHVFAYSYGMPFVGMRKPPPGISRMESLHYG